VELAYILFAAALALIVLSSTWRWVNERRRRNEMTPEECKEFDMTKAFGLRNGALLCPHCQTKGSMRSKEMVRRQEVTVETGNLLRPRHEASVSVNLTQLHCDSCGMTWDV
jgi:uncharacterized Zn finger protein (UPF0148 family)